MNPEDKKPEELTCIIDKIIFSAPPFHIMRTKSGQSVLGDVCVVEDATDPKGQEITLVGNWEKGKYGEQFKFISLKISSANQKEASIEFFLRGIAKVAKKVMNFLVPLGAEKIADIIENDKEALFKIPGMSEKKANLILEKWPKYKTYAVLCDYLLPYGITDNLAYKINQGMGESALVKIKENPYCIVNVKGVGFKTADEFAMKLGIEKTDKRRFDACILYSLNESFYSDGHTCVEPKILFKNAMKELGDDAIQIENCLDILTSSLELLKIQDHIKEIAGFLTTPRIYAMEKFVFDTLKQSSNMSLGQGFPNIESYIAGYENKYSVKLGDKQAEAVVEASKMPSVFALFGYAGTGKTTTIRAIAELYESRFGREKIAGCALAGVAANRIKNQTGFEAKTIHSLLGYEGDGNWKYSENNPLPYSVVLLDEAGMVDLELFYRLLKAIDFSTTVLLIVGDPAQLLPVGIGNILHDILENTLTKYVVLDKIYRQSEDKAIISFAQDIRNNKAPDYKKGGFTDFIFINHGMQGYFRKRSVLSEKDLQPLKDEVVRNIKASVQSELRKLKNEWDELQLTTNNGGFDTLAYISFAHGLAPMKNGELGVAEMNRVAQGIFNPQISRAMIRDNFTLGYKDKVIHLKNADMPVMGIKEAFALFKEGKQFNEDDCDEIRVYNGQIGVVIGFNSEYIGVFYPNDGYVAMYSYSDIRAGILDLAYFTSVHKMQGSEAKNVLILSSMQHAFMLTSKLLYTAVTRAKEKVVIIGEDYAFDRGCKKADAGKRVTLMGKFNLK